MFCRELQDHLQTLEQIFNSHHKVPKACTLGVIIDATKNYIDEEKKHYIKRLKIIDTSFNMGNASNPLKFGYCTVTFFANQQSQLPQPRALGDLIYLRRFSFEKYNNFFQAQSFKSKEFCYWVLFDGDIETIDLGDYSTSRLSLNLQQKKFGTLPPALEKLRKFSRSFLKETSILKAFLIQSLPIKDQDYIVKLLQKDPFGKLKIKVRNKQITIYDCRTEMKVGDYGKLRSIARIEKIHGETVAIKNNFTSLIRVPSWMFDVQNVVEEEDQDDQSLYTPLSLLISSPIETVANKNYWVKCQVYEISALTFQAAVRYYDPERNQLFQKQAEGSQPVYRINFYCRDDSLSNNKMTNLWLFSYDGQGSNFVSSIKLSEINELSSLVQEEKLYRERCNEIMGDKNVVMMVQCIRSQEKERLLRIVKFQ